MLECQAMDKKVRLEFADLLRLRRVSLSLTLMEVADQSHVSASHLGRIERGERFPSAKVLQSVAKPLGFKEEELMHLAGYLSERPAGEPPPIETWAGRLDPFVGQVLAREPIELQRATLSLLMMVKAVAKSWGEVLPTRGT